MVCPALSTYAGDSTRPRKSKCVEYGYTEYDEYRLGAGED